MCTISPATISKFVRWKIGGKVKVMAIYICLVLLPVKIHRVFWEYIIVTKQISHWVVLSIE